MSANLKTPHGGMTVIIEMRDITSGNTFFFSIKGIKIKTLDANSIKELNFQPLGKFPTCIQT